MAWVKSDKHFLTLFFLMHVSLGKSYGKRACLAKHFFNYAFKQDHKEKESMSI